MSKNIIRIFDIWVNGLIGRYGPNGHREKESYSRHCEGTLIQICYAFTRKTDLRSLIKPQGEVGDRLGHWGEKYILDYSNVEQRTCQTGHYTGHTEAFPKFMKCMSIQN